MRKPRRVLLLSMPFGALDRPALGLSLLKPALAGRGIPCDVRYLNFSFSELIGTDLYQWIGTQLPYTAFAGDWTFTGELYGDDPGRRLAFVNEVLRETWRLTGNDVDGVLQVARMTRPFLDTWLAAIPWSEYALVGFTSTFEQNIASLAFAKRIKAAYPKLPIVFGGANWEGPMGLALHRQFPFVDLVCSGESDYSFPELAARIVGGKPVDDPPIRGVVWRADGETRQAGPAEPVRELDALPTPDFSDYFHDLEQSPSGSGIVPSVLFESSRGCWWGAKSHCTFCGLNGGTMAFRSKSAARVLAEIDELVERWRFEFLEAVDNILDMRYFDEVLPALEGRGLKFFYEVKSNLSRAQVETLARAGVFRIQPGIESMNDHVLQLMRKGTTALRNVQLLKWCREYGVGVDFNILYGFPGETAEDYAQMLEILRMIRFLGAPAACGPVRMDRFSPYFEASAAFGMTNVRPLGAYRHLYPFAGETLHDIAYYFDYDYEAAVDPRGFADEVVAFSAQWSAQDLSGELTCSETADGALLVRDTRAEALFTELPLRGLEKTAYEFCDALHPARAVADHLATSCGATVDPDSVRECLDSLVANGVMITDGTNYLSLAVHTPPRWTPAQVASPAVASVG
jgi:ribosomal peptide maturation radical SAM protein 1